MLTHDLFFKPDLGFVICFKRFESLEVKVNSWCPTNGRKCDGKVSHGCAFVSSKEKPGSHSRPTLHITIDMDAAQNKNALEWPLLLLEILYSLRHWTVFWQRLCICG